MPKMKEIPFIVPPEDEQKEIVDFLPKACEKYTRAIQKLEDEIQCLNDYKSRIISDVVTGKYNVQNITIPDFEYVEECFDEEEADLTEEE